MDIAHRDPKGSESKGDLKIYIKGPYSSLSRLSSCCQINRVICVQFDHPTVLIRQRRVLFLIADSMLHPWYRGCVIVFLSAR